MNNNQIVLAGDASSRVVFKWILRVILYLLFQVSAIAESIPANEERSQQWERVIVEEKLHALVEQHGLLIVGIDKTMDAEAVISNEPLPTMIKRLLSDFNYMVVLDDNGDLLKVNIIGQKGAPTEHAGSTVVDTKQEGGHHKIKVGLTGTNGVRHDVMLLVDTGADVVVLEEAMIEVLQLDRKKMTKQVVKTANGETEALKGKIPMVEIKSQKQKMIDAAFLSKDKLGGQQLLGMSMLGKFKITLDDMNGEMLLIPN
ncbi:MAG: retroviral-like aspartic protease family protein [Methylococcales bacterium]